MRLRVDGNARLRNGDEERVSVGEGLTSRQRLVFSGSEENDETRVKRVDRVRELQAERDEERARVQAERDEERARVQVERARWQRERALLTARQSQSEAYVLMN